MLIKDEIIEKIKKNSFVNNNNDLFYLTMMELGIEENILNNKAVYRELSNFLFKIKPREYEEIRFIQDGLYANSKNHNSINIKSEDGNPVIIEEITTADGNKVSRITRYSFMENQNYIKKAVEERSINYLSNINKFISEEDIIDKNGIYQHQTYEQHDSFVKDNTQIITNITRKRDENEPIIISSYKNQSNGKIVEKSQITPDYAYINFKMPTSFDTSKLNEEKINESIDQSKDIIIKNINENVEYYNTDLEEYYLNRYKDYQDILELSNISKSKH